MLPANISHILLHKLKLIMLEHLFRQCQTFSLFNLFVVLYRTAELIVQCFLSQTLQKAHFVFFKACSELANIPVLFVAKVGSLCCYYFYSVPAWSHSCQVCCSRYLWIIQAWTLCIISLIVLLKVCFFRKLAVSGHSWLMIHVTILQPFWFYPMNVVSLGKGSGTQCPRQSWILPSGLCWGFLMPVVLNLGFAVTVVQFSSFLFFTESLLIKLSHPCLGCEVK